MLASVCFLLLRFIISCHLSGRREASCASCGHSRPRSRLGSTVMIATLKKLDKMASDDDALINSAIKKLHEFIYLQYPAKLLWTACTTLAVTTRNTAWFKIRGIILKQILPQNQVGESNPNGPKAGDRPSRTVTNLGWADTKKRQDVLKRLNLYPPQRCGGY